MDPRCSEICLWIDGKRYRCRKESGHDGYHAVPKEIADRDRAAFEPTPDKTMDDVSKSVSKVHALARATIKYSDTAFLQMRKELCNTLHAAADALESVAKENADNHDDAIRLHKEKCDYLDENIALKAKLEGTYRTLESVAKERDALQVHAEEIAEAAGALQEERDALAEALRFYAETGRYFRPQNARDGEIAEIHHDQGSIARAALKGDSEHAVAK